MKFDNPSKICAKPERAPPAAEDPACMVLEPASKRDCITAMTDPKAAVKAWKMEEMSELRESMTEAIISILFVASRKGFQFYIVYNILMESLWFEVLVVDG